VLKAIPLLGIMPERRLLPHMFSNLQKKESGTEVFCWSRRRKDGTIEYAHGKPFHFFINK
jgi:hypothetical protein